MLKGIRENRFSPVFIRFSSSSDSHLYLYDPIHLTASTFCFASLKIEMHSQEGVLPLRTIQFLFSGASTINQRIAKQLHYLAGEA